MSLLIMTQFVYDDKVIAVWGGGTDHSLPPQILLIATLFGFWLDSPILWEVTFIPLVFHPLDIKGQNMLAIGRPLVRRDCVTCPLLFNISTPCGLKCSQLLRWGIGVKCKCSCLPKRSDVSWGSCICPLFVVYPTLWRLNENTVLSNAYPPSDFWKSIAFWEVPRLCKFVLIEEAICKLMWVWSNGYIQGYS